jgi:signal transduction protein with GAF and PtsI domain
LSTSEEIAQALQQAEDGVGQSIAAANTAKDKTEEVITQLSALGVQDKIAEFSALKDAIEALITSLDGSRDKAEQVLAQARAAAG